VPLRPNKKYRFEFSKPEYITAELTLNTEGQVRGDILNDIVLHQESIDNALIYFDYDESIVKEEYLPLMERLVTTLKKFPKSTLNIGAHADSRGGFDYNQRLSNDRARSTVNYFVSQGISRKRITSKGFGEKLLLNRCSDEFTCEEVEHTPNRRAEIKVQLEE
jgi:outer membrane protein OmpA-like peptidoglycan-associated protein